MTLKELQEEITKKFINFADSIVWSNDDGSEKYIGVGNMLEWWLEEIKTTHSLGKKEAIEEVMKEIEVQQTHESLFSHRNGYCKCNSLDSLKDKLTKII